MIVFTAAGHTITVEEQGDNVTLRIATSGTRRNIAVEVMPPGEARQLGRALLRIAGEKE